MANSANATGGPTSLPADLEKLRTMLLSDLKSTIQEALAPLADSINKLRETTEDHGRRVTGIEEDLSGYSDRIVDLEEMCTSLKNTNSILVDTADDLENRSRRCNLRVTNLAEKIEGTNPVKFMSGFFAETLGSDLFPTPPTLDRAHRLGALRSGSNSKPRTMMVTFHYFQDKDRALRVSRDKLNYRGGRVVPDYSAAVTKKRTAFNPVKALLYQKGVKFRMIFPALLKVDHKGETHSFNTAEEAQTFYDQHVGELWVTSLKLTWQTEWWDSCGTVVDILFRLILLHW